MENENRLKTKRFLIFACVMIGIALSRVITIGYLSEPHVSTNEILFDNLAPAMVGIGMVFYAIGLIVKLRKVS